MYRNGEFVWIPSKITVEIEEDRLRGRKNLKLTQEEGWMLRMDIPSDWDLENHKWDGPRLILNFNAGTYAIDPHSQPKLLFALLDGGDKGDEELSKIWQRHAQKQ